MTPPIGAMQATPQTGEPCRMTIGHRTQIWRHSHVHFDFDGR
jgi:hypothetical protein